VVATAAKPKGEPGALSITPADGYQYGDDHPWSGDQQTGLVSRLDKLMSSLGDSPEA
jgi:hypothetical protein